MAEYSPDQRRGFMASWLEFGTLLGYSLGAGLVSVLTVTLADPDLHSWGWRTPSPIGGPLGLIGLYLRYRLEATPAYQESSEIGEGQQQESDEEQQKRPAQNAGNSSRRAGTCC
ncbi:MFS transporter [Salinifilum ghardaiensis]